MTIQQTPARLSCQNDLQHMWGPQCSHLYLLQHRVNALHASSQDVEHTHSLGVLSTTEKNDKISMETQKLLKSRLLLISNGMPSL